MVEAHHRELPLDIIFSKILPRVELKSLLRFKCVSKEWHSFITTPAFAKMQLNHVTTPKLVALSTTQPYKLLTIDCERPQDSFIAGPPFPFKLAPQCESPRNPVFLASAHGLLCIGISKPGQNKAWDVYSDLILWNPATNDHKFLSKPPTSFSCCYLIRLTRYGLCYSSCDDDYKLVQVTHYPRVYIYSLKSDSWRKVELDFKNINMPLFYWSSEKLQSRVSVNGTIYFLVDCIRPHSAFAILMFNTKTETLKVIETPSFGNNQSDIAICSGFKVERDECIHMWVNIRSFPSNLLSRNELWRMDRKGYWTMLVKYGPTSGGLIAGHRPMHLMMNENLLVYDSYRGCMQQLDMKTNSIQDIESTRVWHVGLGYVETMVSPDQYIN